MRCALVTGVQTCALPIFVHPACGVGHHTLGDIVPGCFAHIGEALLAQLKCLDIVGRRKSTRSQKLDEACQTTLHRDRVRSEEHTSELQSLMRISYAVFCLQKTNCTYNIKNTYLTHV